MDERRITIKDIAQRVGVSPRTVSLVMNGQGRISAETRSRVQSVAKELNYQPNILARGLVNQRTYLIGVVVPYLTTSFFTNILSGIEERALELGYDLVLGNSTSSAVSEKGVVQRMVNRKVDGIICAPDPRYYEFYDRLLGTGIPIVEIMTHIKGSNATSVLVDDVEGGYLAGSHLLDLGHRHIGFLAYLEDFYEEIRLRRDGYRKAFLSRGVSMDPDRYEVRCDLTPQGAFRAVTSLLNRSHDVTAIIAPTDMAAIGAVQAILAAGLRIPEDLSVIGYDDLDVARYQVTHPLTTISQPKEEVGRLAFELMYRKITEQTDIAPTLLRPQLVVRTTTGPARSGARR